MSTYDLYEKFKEIIEEVRREVASTKESVQSARESRFWKPAAIAAGTALVSLVGTYSMFVRRDEIGALITSAMQTETRNLVAKDAELNTRVTVLEHDREKR